jgi:hypothetical protein
MSTAEYGRWTGEVAIVAGFVWRIETCELSSSPSIPCSQLDSWIHTVALRCDFGRSIHGNWGSDGGSPLPMNTHTMSAFSSAL